MLDYGLDVYFKRQVPNFTIHKCFSLSSSAHLLSVMSALNVTFFKILFKEYT